MGIFRKTRPCCITFPNKAHVNFSHKQRKNNYHSEETDFLVEALPQWPEYPTGIVSTANNVEAMKEMRMRMHNKGMFILPDAVSYVRREDIKAVLGEIKEPQDIIIVGNEIEVKE